MIINFGHNSIPFSKASRFCARVLGGTDSSMAFLKASWRNHPGQRGQRPQGDHILEFLIPHFHGDLRRGDLDDFDVRPGDFLDHRQGIDDQKASRVSGPSGKRPERVGKEPPGHRRCGLWGNESPRPIGRLRTCRLLRAIPARRIGSAQHSFYHRGRPRCRRSCPRSPLPAPRIRRSGSHIVSFSGFFS